MATFEFSAGNFRNPLTHFPRDRSSVRVLDVPVTMVSDGRELDGFGVLLGREELSEFVPGKRFEIVKWPVSGAVG